MKIKDTPTTYSDYYKSMQDRASQRREEVEKEISSLDKEVDKLHKEISNNLDNISFNPRKYEEFVRNKYIDGTYLKGAKTAVLNRKGNYTLVSELLDIYKLAKLQKELYDTEVELHKLDKMLDLTRNEYREIIKTFYTEVHRQLILEGNGYAFEGCIGWICINRIKIPERKVKTLDYAATKRKKAEIIAAGKKVWNKEEADYCREHGLEYDALDHRVYKQSNEYHYEIPLIACRLKNATDLVFKIVDYRNSQMRGKTNTQIVEENNYDVNKIINLSCDLKTKVTLCDEADKTLYINLIRNENQESVVRKSSSRKNRQ